MKSLFTVCFFGHRSIENFRLAEERTEALIRNLLVKKEYVEFLVGREGEYDQIVSSAIHRVKRTMYADNCSHVWVMPYHKAELMRNLSNFESYYDAIEICEASAAAHPKAAIQVRNRCMVDRSDLCVFFLERTFGGAWQTMRYAISCEKETINLSTQ